VSGTRRDTGAAPGGSHDRRPVHRNPAPEPGKVRGTIDDHPLQSSLMARTSSRSRPTCASRSAGRPQTRSPCTCRSGQRDDGAACSRLVRCRGENEDHGPRGTAYRGATPRSTCQRSCPMLPARLRGFCCAHHRRPTARSVMPVIPAVARRMAA
jgi:hypothetical protein